MDDRPNMSMDRYASAQGHFRALSVPVPRKSHNVTLIDREGLPYVVNSVTGHSTARTSLMRWCVRALAFWLALGVLAYGLWCA